jgi:hypothetical protein
VRNESTLTRSAPARSSISFPKAVSISPVVTHRRIKRGFGLDDDALEDPRRKLIGIHRSQIPASFGIPIPIILLIWLFGGLHG